MALIICPECQKQISDHAASCPNCGFPLQRGGYDGAVGDGLLSLEKRPRKKGRKKKVIIILTISTLVCACIAVCAVLLFNNYKQREFEAEQASIAQEKALQESIAEESAQQEAAEKAKQEALAEQARKEARAEYISDLKNYVQYVRYGCYESLLACELTRAVWHDSICQEYDQKTAPYTQTDGKFHSDFNDSLAKLMASQGMQESAEAIRRNRETVGALYKDLLNPDSEFKGCFEQVETLYDLYYDYTSLALIPIGSLNSFTEDYVMYTEETAAICDKLDLMIPEE